MSRSYVEKFDVCVCVCVRLDYMVTQLMFDETGFYLQPHEEQPAAVSVSDIAASLLTRCAGASSAVLDPLIARPAVLDHKSAIALLACLFHLL